MSAWLTGIPLLADWATRTLDNLDPSKRFALIVVLIGCTTGVICTLITVVSTTINSIHHRRVETDMKREMIERGMSAEEITKVIEAAMPPEDATQRWIASWAKKKA